MDQKRRYLFLWMVISGGVFFIISGLAVIILNRLSRSTETPISPSANEVNRITVSSAKAAFDAGTAIFIDVRDIGSYEEAHIPGALHIPLGDLTNHLKELDPSSWIITYCT